MTLSKKKWIILIIVGVVAGFANGILGTGGGILIIFVLNAMFKEGDSFKENMITTLAAIVPMSIVSAVVYIIGGNTDVKLLAVYLPGAFVGGFIGSILMNRLKTKTIRNIFAAMVIYAGIKMIIG